MRFLSPEWLIVVPMLGWIGWKWKALGLWRPLRFCLLVLLVFLLMQPELRRLGVGLDLWVLVDRSASAEDGMARHLQEIESLLRRSKSADDRLFFVDYAELPVLRAEGTGDSIGSRNATGTSLAARYALSQMETRRASRMLVLSDGYSNNSLAGLTERMIRQSVPLDYRLVSPREVEDFAVREWRIPSHAQPGEPFLVELQVTGSSDGVLPVEIRRDGKTLSRSEVTVRNGVGSLRFTDRISQGGAFNYSVRLLAENDGRPGNDSASAWIEIRSGPRILLLTNYQDDPLVGVLRNQGFEVEVQSKPKEVGVGRLAGASAVLLNNVPAYALAPDFLQALDFYVREEGGGLLMAGGKFSFGAGAYAGSAIDDLLPMSMELRMEHRKLAVALAIVMDRSGSMGAGVGGGISKMDLANEGAARSVELLGAHDAVTVFAVDSKAHAVVPLTSVGEHRTEIVDAVRRITSGGGGIFVATGLQAGWEQLKLSQAGQRHLILFADAADAEEPGAYREILAEMKAGGSTISVIGLGTESDSDAEFLKDIAARGGGRIFFNADPASLPALFEQETIAVARSAFLTEPVGVSPTAGWLEIAARPLDWLAKVDAYNLNYLRPEATAAAYSSDEYSAPLVAFWQRGAGRAAGVAFPLAGEFSESVRHWSAYGDFLQTLVRWLAGEEVPPGISLRPRVDGDELNLDLRFDDSWQERFARSAPKLVLAQGLSGEAIEATWERLTPGHYRASVPLPVSDWLRGVVQIGEFTLPFGPIAGRTNPEWTFDPERLRELETVSTASGGRERIDLGKIWESPRQREFSDLRPYLLWTFLLTFLAEVFWTRWGGRQAGVSSERRTPRKIKPQTKNPRKGTAPIPPAKEATKAQTEEPSGSSINRQDRFRRAKKGK